MNPQKISYLTLGITLINTALIIVLLIPKNQPQVELASGIDFLSKFYKTQDEAKRDVNGFRKAKKILIPYALNFESHHLETLAKRNPYIRFYFGTKDSSDTLTLLAVGVKPNNIDDDTVPGEDLTRIVEFADPCPICSTMNQNTKYPQQQSLLYPFSATTLPNESQRVFTFYSKDGCPK